MVAAFQMLTLKAALKAGGYFSMLDWKAHGGVRAPRNI